MITVPTVLILGAGASVDYGFPTGRGLLLGVCQNTTPDSRLYTFLTENMERSRTQIDDFRNALLRSSAPSVDLFLEYRKDFEEIGKLAIAGTLIPHEDYSSFGPIAERRWYETLFHLMVEGGQFEENRLSVITFNYDRSLEAFFFQALQNLYALDNKQAEERLRKIHIIHLYGSLGTRLAPVGNQRGYETELRGDWIETAADSIKILHSQARLSQEFETAYYLLGTAAEIIFLGFGFHPVNVQRLRLDEAVRTQAQKPLMARWLACRTGMGDGDIVRAKHSLGDVPVEFAQHESWKINDFLRNTECLVPM